MVTKKKKLADNGITEKKEEAWGEITSEEKEKIRERVRKTGVFGFRTYPPAGSYKP